MVSAVLLQRGYRVITASFGEQAVQHAIAQHPDAILISQRELPDLLVLDL